MYSPIVHSSFTTQSRFRFQYKQDVCTFLATDSAEVRHHVVSDWQWGGTRQAEEGAGGGYR